MTRVIITGFGAFPGVEENPTQALVAHLRARADLLPQGSDLDLLPVDYRLVSAQIDALLDRLAETGPTALLLTGYSNLASAITLEHCATPHCAPDKPDVNGHVPPPHGSDMPTLETGIDLTALQAELGELALPCTLSRDAGQYLCNYSYRHALLRVSERELATQVLFIHLPALPGTPLAATAAGTLALEDMARAVGAVARKLVL